MSRLGVVNLASGAGLVHFWLPHNAGGFAEIPVKDLAIGRLRGPRGSLRPGHRCCAATRHPSRPEGATMPRSLTFVPAVLAALLAVAGCGSDDTTEEAPRPAMSEVAAADTDEPHATTESAERLDPLDAAPEPEPEPEPQPVTVRLGDRFPWCADVQANWDRFDDSRLALTEAETAFRQAQDALAATTDELDQAEAREAMKEARRNLLDAQDAHDSAEWEAVVNGLGRARRLHLLRDDDPQDIAYSRAWVAFMDRAAPNIVAAANNLESAQTAYDTAKATADGLVAQAEADLDAAHAAEDEARAMRNAASAVPRESREGAGPSLAAAFEEAWAAGEAAVEAARSSNDEDHRLAVAAYDSALAQMGAAGTRWVEAYDANRLDHEALAAALAEHNTARSEVIAALVGIDVAASQAITDTLADLYAVTMPDFDAYTVIAEREAAYGVALSAVEDAEASYQEAWQQAHQDSEAAYAPVKEAEEALTNALYEAVRAGDGYDAFRDSFRESCQP